MKVELLWKGMYSRFSTQDMMLFLKSMKYCDLAMSLYLHHSTHVPAVVLTMETLLRAANDSFTGMVLSILFPTF
jgi:hypothetical protein